MKRAMRSVAVALILGLAVASPSSGALHSLSTSMSFVSELVPPFTFTGAGYGNSDGPGLPFSLGAGLFAGEGAAGAITPTFVGLTSFSIPANSYDNAAATFDLNGAMGLSGSLFFNHGSAGSIPLLPLGGGGTHMAVVGGIPIQIIGATWQYSAQKIFTAKGKALANAVSASATAYDNRTAGGEGTVQLVAPATILMSGGALGNIPTFGVLTISYGPVVPEPATLLLLGTGIASLSILGHKQRKRV